MSEIQRYEVDGFGDVLPNQSSGKWVRFTDHEAAIEQVLADAKARIEGLKFAAHGTGDGRNWNDAIDAALAALNQPQTESMGAPEELCCCRLCQKRDRGGAAAAAGVADADPVEGHREEGERPHVDPAIVERHTYNGGEVHVYPDGAVSIEGGLVWVGDLWSALNRSVEGATASPPLGVADADLVRVGDFFGIPAFTHPDVKPGIVGIVSAGEVTATITGTAPQRPGDAIKKEES